MLLQRQAVALCPSIRICNNATSQHSYIISILNATLSSQRSTDVTSEREEGQTSSGSGAEKLQQFRDHLDDGPQLSDFIGGVVPRNSTPFAAYSGKIKREPGETGRYVLLKPH